MSNTFKICEEYSTKEIAFSVKGKIGLITLKREKALNALNLSMICALHKMLEIWEKDEKISCVLIEGEGRAFCAGGDIISLYHSREKSSLKERTNPEIFFKHEYTLNAYIRNYKKPYISYLNGFVMGGGAGISMHGTHRIVTKNTVFSMPEAAIGFFADAGANVFLKDLPLALRLYICLTAARLFWGDCLHFNLGTHAIDEKDYALFKEGLVKTGDPDLALKDLTLAIPKEMTIDERNFIENCFNEKTLEGCFNKIKEHLKGLPINSKFTNIYEKLISLSPLSLKVIFTYFYNYDPHLYSVAFITDLEAKIAYNLLKQNDFYEGVRSVLINKNTVPQWQYNAIELVPDALVKDICCI